MSLTIDSDFDGGNIRCLAARAPDRIRLEIVPDAGGEFFQWFYFSVRGAAGKDCVLRIENAGGVTYPDGWRDYRAVASEDGEDLAPRRDRVRRQGADDPPQARRRRGALRLLRALPDGAPCRAYRTHGDVVLRHRAAARPNPRRCAARPAGDRRGAGADLLDHRAPASRRDHGRMVDGGFSRAAAGPRRSARPRAAREGAVLRGAQHEPRRQPPRASQDQRGGHSTSTAPGPRPAWSRARRYSW